jgi:hypothetical protein
MYSHHVMAAVASHAFARVGLWSGYMGDDTRRSALRFTPEDLNFANVHVTQLSFVLNKHVREALHVWGT